MLAQEIEVPDRLLWETVVSDHNRALLVVAQAQDRDGRDLGHAEPLRHLQPEVTGENGPGLVDQNGNGPNPTDALHQGGDLGLRMLPGIFGIRLQTAQRTPGDLVHQASPWAG